jgi:hypothetical protein
MRKMKRKLFYEIRRQYLVLCRNLHITTGLWDVEAPQFLANRLTDDGEVSALALWADSWYSFILEAESTLGPHFSWKD